MEIDASELEVLGRDISDLGQKAHDRAAQVVAKTAADISGSAARNAPYRTGNLSNSIGYDLYGLEAEIGPTASYGIFLEYGTSRMLEYGTSRMAPRPYMKPALEKHEGAFLQALSQLGDLS